MNWNAPNKIDSRKNNIERYQSIFNNKIPSDKEYWSLCGDLSSSNNEYEQIINAGLIEPYQFNGIEKEKDIYQQNKLIYPDLKFHHGTINNVICEAEIFNPAILNIDTMLEVKKGLKLFFDIIFFIIKHEVKDCLISLNYMLNNPWNNSDKCYRSDYFLEHINKNQSYIKTYNIAKNKGWEILPNIYTYERGTGERSKTVMQTIYLSNKT